MKTARDLTIIGLYTAILLCSQFLLSSIQGVEVVSALFCCFCFFFSIYQGIFVAVCFSLFRCLIFGFYPSVLVLYIIYYILFAVAIGFLGKLFKHNYSIKSHIFCVIAVAILTCIFTLLDDIITPLFYGITGDAFKAYFISSFAFMWIQVVSATISTAIFFPVLIKLFKLVFNR